MRSVIATAPSPDNGLREWHTMTVPERAGVRHGWADTLEGAWPAHDAQPHPYTNWGYANRLAWVLATNYMIAERIYRHVVDEHNEGSEDDA